MPNPGLTAPALAEAWRAQGDRGARFAASLLAFLRVHAPETQRSYAFAVCELWDWLAERQGGKLPPPDRVDRATAADYLVWLRTRRAGVLETRLRADPASALELAVLELVRRVPGVPYADLVAALQRLASAPSKAGRASALAERVRDVERAPAGWDRYLASLVERRIVRRSPTMAELRRIDPTLLSRLDERVDPALFRYYPADLEARGVERYGTIRARLAALSAFWGHCIERSGENTGEGALLAHNVWSEHLDDVGPVASDQARVHRAKTTPTAATFEKLLATTRDQHGLPSTRLDDLRDQLALLLLWHYGLRATELTSLRRDSLSITSPRMLTIVGKRNRVRRFPLAPAVAEALAAFEGRLRELAFDDQAEDGIRSPRLAALLEDAAPLVPAVSRWGEASLSPRAEREDGITRQAVAMMLRRRAERAGIAPGSEEWSTVHPHGFRHASATAAADRGKPMHQIQSMLGHSSLATTGRYVEHVDADELYLHDEDDDETP